MCVVGELYVKIGAHKYFIPYTIWDTGSQLCAPEARHISCMWKYQQDKAIQTIAAELYKRFTQNIL